MRSRATFKGPVPFTPEEEVAQDAKDAQSLIDEADRLTEEAGSVSVSEAAQALLDSANNDNTALDKIKSLRVK